MTVHKVVRAAVASLECQHSITELWQETPQRGLFRPRRAGVDLDHPRPLVDYRYLRRIRVRTTREDVHRVRAPPHLMAQLADVHVHPAAVAGAGARKGRCMDGNDRYVTHASLNDITAVNGFGSPTEQLCLSF